MIAVSTFHIMMNTISKQVNDKDIKKLGLPTEWQGRNEWADCALMTQTQWTHMLFLLTDVVELEDNHNIDKYLSPLWAILLEFD